jgi:hypothetical protein
METYTFVFKSAVFDDLMNGKGAPPTETKLFAKIAQLNSEGNHVRVISEGTGELIHEFLPTSRSNESSEARDPD